MMENKGKDLVRRRRSDGIVPILILIYSEMLSDSSNDRLVQTQQLRNGFDSSSLTDGSRIAIILLGSRRGIGGDGSSRSGRLIRSRRGQSIDMTNGSIFQVHHVGVSGVYEVGGDLEIFDDCSWYDGDSVDQSRRI